MNRIRSQKRMLELALAEDIGPGDITTKALALKGRRGEAVVYAKAIGVISGLAVFRQVYKLLSPSMTFTVYNRDGSSVVPGNRIVMVRGPLSVILTGERTAMNVLSLLSGTATLARKYVEAVKGYHSQVLDTRKTVPGMRTWQKKAVVDGGANNHRRGLHDMYLVKENHIEAAGGLEVALDKIITDQRKTRAKVEVEVKNLDELRVALKFAPDYVLLDNFSLNMLRKAVTISRKINPQVILEASGNVDLKTIRKIAATGVDRISVGKLTHSAPVLDLSMKITEYRR